MLIRIASLSVILMDTHNIGFYEEMAKIIFQFIYIIKKSSNMHFNCSSDFFFFLHITVDPNLGSPGDGFNQPNPPGKRRKKSRVT